MSQPYAPNSTDPIPLITRSRNTLVISSETKMISDAA